jgi:hypothetical protein
VPGAENTNPVLHERLVRRCRACGTWGRSGDILCPECRTPFVNIDPPARRPKPLIAFVLVLAAIVALVLFTIHTLVV